MLHGRYVDGVRPVAQDVEVLKEAEGLVIRLPHASTPILWPFGEICIEEDGLETRLMHVRQELDTGERLSLNSVGFGQMFGAERRRFRTRRPGEAGGWRIAGWSLFAVASLAMILLVGLPAFARIAAPLVPYSWEVALGEGVEQEVLEMVGAASPFPSARSQARRAGQRSMP